MSTLDIEVSETQPPDNKVLWRNFYPKTENAKPPKVDVRFQDAFEKNTKDPLGRARWEFIEYQHEGEGEVADLGRRVWGFEAGKNLYAFFPEVFEPQNVPDRMDIMTTLLNDFCGGAARGYDIVTQTVSKPELSLLPGMGFRLKHTTDTDVHGCKISRMLRKLGVTNTQQETPLYRPKDE